MKNYSSTFSTTDAAKYFCRVLFRETGLTGSTVNSTAYVNYESGEELARIKEVRKIFN